MLIQVRQPAAIFQFKPNAVDGGAAGHLFRPAAGEGWWSGAGGGGGQ